MPSRFVLEFGVAQSPKPEVIESSGEVNWLIDGPCGERLPSIDLATGGEQAQNITAAVSAEGSTVWVLIRRLNSSCSHRVSRSSASPLARRQSGEDEQPIAGFSRLSATGRCLSRICG
jgi:hypothetical protein